MKNSPLTKEPVWKTHKSELVAWFLGLFFVSLGVLYVFNLVPAELEFGGFSFGEQKTMPETNSEGVAKQILPAHITIPKIGVDVSISNPESDNVDVLDEYLKKGAVRYPGSGSLAGGNMFLFAHSTGFKVVQNQAYKAFNNLKDLGAGDNISVKGEDGKVYEYKVSSVKLASDKDVLVSFDKNSHRLTLSTCNTFGKKEERYVVEASFDKMNVDSLTL